MRSVMLSANMTNICFSPFSSAFETFVESEKRESWHNTDCSRLATIHLVLSSSDNECGQGMAVIILSVSSFLSNPPDPPPLMVWLSLTTWRLKERD